MLKKSHISNMQIYSRDWEEMRKGRFTSSRISNIIGEEGVTKVVGMSYIYQKAGEKITNKSMADEDDVIEDENTAWGREKMPHLVKLVPDDEAIDLLLKTKRQDGSLDSVEEENWNGIVFYNDRKMIK